MSEAHQIVAGIVPKHEQLRAILVDMCTHELSPGDALPSERQLCQQYGVSRVTVREAIGQLVTEGLLVRVRARGTFVADRAYRSELHLASFHEDMRRLGLRPGTVVLTAELRTPPPRTTLALGLGEQQKAWHVLRLRLADDAPISVDDAWYHAELLPGLDETDLTASIYDTLAMRYGRPIDRAEQTVSARQAPPEIAAPLGLPKNGTVLMFDRVAYSGDQPIEHSQSWYRSDRYQLQMTLSSSQR